MKKIFAFVGSSFFALFLLTGCGTDNTDMLTCTYNSDGVNIKVDTVYDISYVNDEVKEVRVMRDYVSVLSSNDVDGVKTGTDGVASDDDAVVNDGEVDSDDIVDGVVGDAIDVVTGAVVNTILDISGVKQDYGNRVANYADMPGFDSKVEVDTDQRYKFVYTVNMDEISDTNLARFNYSRSLSELRTNLEGQGLTCK